MDKKQAAFTIVLLSILLIAIGTALLKDKPADESPECADCNVVFIIVDALRPDRLGCYGYARNTSPNIDKFAKENLLFTDALAQAPYTLGSMPSILRSKYPTTGNETSGRKPTLAEILKNNGYATAAFTDGGVTRIRFGLDRGFDKYKDEPYGRGLKGINREAADWLGENREKKLFLLIHTYDVHCPYTPPEPYYSMFTGGRGLEVDPAACDGYFGLTGAEHGYLSDVYDGGVRYMDAMLGELLDSIGRLDLENNTVVVITADHGESLGEHGFVGHGNLHNTELSVPLAMRIPGRAGRTINEPVEAIDVYPTLLSVLGITPPIDAHGFDLVPVIRGDFSFNNSRVRISEAVNRRAVRFGNYSLVMYRTAAGEDAGGGGVDAAYTVIVNGRNWTVDELYDLEYDRAEERNIIRQNLGLAKSIADRADRRLREAGEEYDLVQSLKAEQLTSGIEEELESLGYLV